MGSMGRGPMGEGRWARADVPRGPPRGYISGPEADGPQGPPVGYISGPEADGAPWAPWASGTPPWGYHLIVAY